MTSRTETIWMGNGENSLPDRRILTFPNLSASVLQWIVSIIGGEK